MHNRVWCLHASTPLLKSIISRPQRSAAELVEAKVRCGLLIMAIFSVTLLSLLAFAAVMAQAPTRDTRSWTDPSGSGVTITFSVPQTYESCNSTGDRIFTEGVPDNWRLFGSVQVYWATPSGQVLINTYEIRQNGDLDLFIEYPPASTWPDLTPIGNPLREIHVSPQILVQDERGRDVPWVGGDQQFAPGILGAGGQVWDVICLPTNLPTPTDTPVGPTPTSTPVEPTPTNTPGPGTAALGDRVWNDTNGNGVQDIGEFGVPGVRIELLANCSGETVLATTTTNVNGNYIFNNLAAGQYRVRFTLPGGFSSFSPKDAILDDDYDSDANLNGVTDCITLSTGEQNFRIDAGLISGAPTPTPTNTTAPQLGSIGDRVFRDDNSNGIQNAGEPGVPGVTVQLKDCSNNILRTTQTDSNGNYLFDGLAAGCYRIGIVPNGFTISPVNQGTDDTRDSDVDPATATTGNIDLGPGEDDPTQDAGLIPAPVLGAIGDRVWRDNDGDTVQDPGEPSINGVTVVLRDPGPNNVCDADDPVIATQVTSGDGNYLFTGLVAGRYCVDPIGPDGFSLTTNNDPQTVNLAPGQNFLDADFGYRQQLACGLALDQKCIVPAPPPTTNFNCSDAKPLNELSMIWSGSQTVDVRAWKGSVGSTLLATITNVAPGDKVVVSGYAGAPNDVIWEIFAAGTNSKVGESTFHLSCSDDDMDGPEDCGAIQGDGKGKSGFLNVWELDGLAGNGLRLACSTDPTPPADACTVVAGGGSVCNGTKPKSLTFRFTGGSCSDSTNPQGGKFQCSGSPGGGTVSIIVLKDADKISVTPRTVAVGDEFTITRNDGKELGSETKLAVGGQSLNIHTSCSQALNLGDVFGSLVLVAADGQRLDTPVTFTFLVSNSGDDLSNVTLEDSFGQVVGPFSLATGATRTFAREATIEDTITNLGFVQGFLANGAMCSDEDRTTVTVEPVPLSCEEGKPTALVFEFTGGSCSETTNPQNGKLQCSGNPGSTPVSITLLKDADKISVTPSTVSVGERFVIARRDGSNFASETILQVGGQRLNIHTSCSQALNVGDVFGSLRLVQFVPEGFPVPTIAGGSTSSTSIFLPMISR